MCGIFPALSTVNFPRDAGTLLRDNVCLMSKAKPTDNIKETLRLRLLANIDARTKALNISDRALSLAAKGNPDVIRNMRKGSLPRSDTLSAIATVLGCTSDDLQAAPTAPRPEVKIAEGENEGSTTGKSSAILLNRYTAPKIGPNDLPVLGTAVGGQDGFFDLNGQVKDYIERPQQLFGIAEAYAIYIEEESMVPRYMPGEVVYVHPGRPLTMGCFVVIQLRPDKEGDPPKALIKQLIRRTSAKITLSQLNPGRELEFNTRDVVSMHRVVWAGELR